MTAVLTDEDTHKMSSQWVMELLTAKADDIGRLLVKILQQPQVYGVSPFGKLGLFMIDIKILQLPQVGYRQTSSC